MNAQCGLVRGHSLGFSVPVMAPKGQAYQILAVRRRVVSQTVDAALDLEPGTTLGVVVLLRIDIASMESLGRGKVSSLGGSYLIQSLSVLLWISSHRIILI
jgi:hypothetical protein